MANSEHALKHKLWWFGECGGIIRTRKLEWESSQKIESVLVVAFETNRGKTENSMVEFLRL